MLLASAAAALAEPAEPLTVTQLVDPEARLQAVALSDNESASNPDYQIEDFRRAISETVRAQQQSIRDSCRSQHAASDKATAWWAWESACYYHRY